MTLILGPGAGQPATATSKPAGRADALPDLRLVPVRSAGTWTFQPGYGSTASFQGVDFNNNPLHSDLAVKLDSVPAGTEAERQVTYATIIPTGNGFRASATLTHTGVNVTVETDVRQVAVGVWKKTVSLTADAATTVAVRLAHTAPDGLTPQHFAGFLGRNTPTTGPTSWSPVNVAAHLPDRMPQRTVATTLIAGDGVRNEWFRVSGTGTSHQLLLSGGDAGAGRYLFGVTYGQGTGNSKRMALAAGVTRTLTWTYAALPFNSGNLSEWYRGVHRAQALAENVGGDLFTKVCASTAIGCLSQATNTDTGAWLIPAATYGSTTYVRDGFWTAVGLDRPEVSAALLARFAAAISTNRVPTFFKVDSVGAVTTPFIVTDESNMLFLIWTWWHAQRYGTVVPTTAQLDAAILGITGNLDASSRYIESNVGTAGVGWMDSLTNPGFTAATSAYNQGLVYVALRCAQLLGRAVDATMLAATKTRYTEFHNGTRMRFAYDRTAGTYPLSVLAMPDLAPEFWANYVLNETVLTAAQVASHLDSLFSANAVDLNGGRVFRQITYADGTYLPASLWKVYVPSGASVAPAPGIYQNGGSWLLFDFLNLAVGRYHGYASNDLDVAWERRVRAEFGRDVTLHEYIATQNDGDPGLANTLGTCPQNSFAYGWNAMCGPVEAWAGLRRSPISA